MRRRTLIINLVLVLLLVAGGVTAYFMVFGDRPAEATPQQRTVAVAQGTVTASVTSDGTVQSANVARADFTTSGRVTEIPVKVGDVVTQGATLAKVDATEPEAELAMAKKNLTAAKEAQVQVDQAKAAVESAQRKVDGTVLKAPMAGTVVAINGSAGGLSNAEKGFIQLADLSKLEISASVPEADATRLKPDQSATVTWNALTGVSVTGKVASIAPTAVSSGSVVSYPVVVALDSIPEGAKLGQSVKLTVIVEQIDNTVYVPNAALRSAGGRNMVTVVAGGQSLTRPVEIGLKGDSFTVITSGLAPGEHVVLATAQTGNIQLPPGFNPGLRGGGPR